MGELDDIMRRMADEKAAAIQPSPQQRAIAERSLRLKQEFVAKMHEHSIGAIALYHLTWPPLKRRFFWQQERANNSNAVYDKIGEGWAITEASAGSEHPRIWFMLNEQPPRMIVCHRIETTERTISRPRSNTPPRIDPAYKDHPPFPFATVLGAENMDIPILNDEDAGYVAAAATRLTR